jgi:hypothetical protein
MWIRSSTVRMAMLVAGLSSGCSASALDPGGAGVDGGDAVSRSDGDAPKPIADATPKSDAGADVSPKSDADDGPCGPYPYGLDCDGPCGLGFVSPTCQDGFWTCPGSSYDPLQMPCYCLAQAWQNHLGVLDSPCNHADDCVIVGGTATCECAPALRSGSGDAISKQSIQTAQAYLSRFEQCKHDPAFQNNLICGSAPAVNLRCEQGECRSDDATCEPVTDAGIDAQ